MSTDYATFHRLRTADKPLACFATSPR